MCVSFCLQKLFIIRSLLSVVRDEVFYKQAGYTGQVTHSASPCTNIMCEVEIHIASFYVGLLNTKKVYFLDIRYLIRGIIKQQQSL